MQDKVAIFRQAFIETLKTVEEVPGDIVGFPAGACEVSSIMLMTYLKSLGFNGITYVSGTRPTTIPAKTESHSFLKHEDIYIDITGSQFDDCTDEIIFHSDHELHATFELENRGETDIYQYSSDGWVNYVPFYEQLVTVVEGGTSD